TVTIPSTSGSQTVTVTNHYLCKTTSACASLPANMVSWWPLNEQEGATVVTDIKGGHNGTPSGPLVGWDALPAKVGGRKLTVGDHVTVPNDASLQFGTGNFSVDAWFGIGEPRFIGGIVDKLDIAAKKGYALYVQDDHVKLVMGNGMALVTFTSAAPVGIVFGTMAWHHVAVTVDRSGGPSTFYIDGKSAGTFTALPISISIATTSALLIGGSRQTFPTNTCVCEYFLDEVEIFNGVLSASDIKAIFDAGSAGKCTAGIHGKKFNDLNQNKVPDAGEQGLSGWTIRVTEQGGNTQSTTTDAQGNYSFSVPAPGTFTLSEVKQDGWFPTTGARTITLAANESADVNFGNIDVRRREFTLASGMNEFCIWGGGGPLNSRTPIDNPNSGVLTGNNSPPLNTGGVRFGAFGLCYGRILWANDKVAFKYTFTATPVAVISYTDNNFVRDPDSDFFRLRLEQTRRNVYGAGLSPIGFQFYFRPQSSVKPFVNTSGGFIFFKDPVPRLNGAQFNFTYDFGGGVQVFRDSRRAFNFGYKYQHLSNGGRALNNPGFDGHVFYFGYSIFKAR
ncbi:MAG: acyloxyacyl hydrolase, partial [Pyrinomonadaceae bacterium]